MLRAKTPQGTVDKPLPAMSCDADYPALIGMELTVGRMFDANIPTDQGGSIIVNESLVKAFGWSDPLNEKLYIPGDSVDQEFRIIGVVKDFHYASLHTPIEPLAIFQSDPRYGVNNLMVRLAPGDVQGQLACPASAASSACSPMPNGMPPFSTTASHSSIRRRTSSSASSLLSRCSRSCLR